MRNIGIVIVGMAALPAAAQIQPGIWSGFVAYFGKPKPGEVRPRPTLTGLFLASGEFRLYSSDGSQVAGTLKADAKSSGKYQAKATYFPPEAGPSACSLHDVSFEPGKWMLGTFLHGSQRQILSLGWDKDNEPTADGKFFPAGVYLSEAEHRDFPDELTLEADGAFTVKRSHGGGSLTGRLTQAKGNLFKVEGKAIDGSAAGGAAPFQGLACIVKEGVLILADDGKHAFLGTFDKPKPAAATKGSGH